MEKKKNIRIGISISILALIIFGYLVFSNWAKVMDVLSPFIIGLIIAYLLTPLMQKLEKRKVPRGIAISLIAIFFLIIFCLFLNQIIPILYSNISDLISNIPSYTTHYYNMVNWVQSQVNYSSLPVQMKEIIAERAKGSIQYFEGFSLSVLQSILGAIGGVFSFLLNFLLGIFIAIYLMKDKEMFLMQLKGLIPKKWRETFISTSGEINIVISKYLRGQLLVLLFVATLETIGLGIVGIKYFLFLGIIGGIANVIPYFGPFIGAVPAIIVALLDNPMKALLAILVFMIVQQIDNSIVSPKIMSDSMGLHPLTIIMVVMFFGTFFGITGMIIAVPLTAILKVIGKKVFEKIA